MPSLNKLRQRLVTALQPDIEAIDSNDLETLAHGLVQVIERRPLIQRGINARGRPVGYTVDSFNADQSIIMECSARADTFTPDFGKMRGDIAHAREHNPGCVRLYFVSSMRCPEGMSALVAQMIREEAFGSCIIEWYDSRRIAETIFDHVIVNDNRRDFFADLLPELDRLFAEYIFGNAAPPPPEDLVEDAARADAISQALVGHCAVNLFNLSGAGKTYAAIAYADKQQDAYSAVFWLRGEDLRHSTDLRAVHLQRSGVAMNLTVVLRDTPCLVVIDNYPVDGPRLGSLLPAKIHSGARVLTTALHPLQDGSVHDVELPPLSGAVAHAILGQGKIPPSRPEADEIIRFTGGHALILAILRDTVDELGASWASVIADIRDNLALYESRDHQTILDRILTKHCSGIVDELHVLKWLAAPLLEAQFAEHVMGLAGLAKLRRRSILRPVGLGMFKLHDLLLQCLKHFGVTGSRGLNPEARFWEYFEDTWEKSPSHFQRSLHLHRESIVASVDRDDPEPGLPGYLTLLLEDCPLSERGIAKLAAQDMRAHLPNRAALGAIVEAAEWCIRLGGDGEKEQLLREAIRRLTEAIERASDPVIRADLFHHRGKFHHWLGARDEAIADYQAVLDLFPDNWAALLQMARVQAKQQAGTYLKRVIDAYEHAPAEVPSTIILAALNELGNPAHSALRTEIITTRVKVIQTAISSSLVTGYSQPYRMLGRLGRHLAFPHPDVLLQIAGAVTFPPVEHAKNEEVFDIAECLKSIGKAHREESGDANAHQSWCRQAIPYYERLSSPNGFRLTMHAECLNLLQDFTAADNVLGRAPAAEREGHWWHRKAQTLLGLGKTEEALSALTHSFGDIKAASFLGTFLQTRAKIQAAQNDPACIESARLAMGSVNLEKHRRQIVAELETYEARF